MTAGAEQDLQRFSPGDRLDNPALDLRSVVLEDSPDVLRSRVEAGPGGNAGPLHRHLRQEERFVVEEGTLRVRLGLRGSRLVSAGEQLAVPIGKAHTFRVEGDGARFVVEFRPAHQVAQFFRALFALASDGRLTDRGNPRLIDLAVLMQRYPEDFFYAPVIPPAMQRALARPLAGRSDR